MACSTVRPRPSQMSRYSWTGSAEVFSTGWWKLDKTWHFYWDGDFTNQNDHRNSDLMTSGDTMISGFPKWTQWFPSRLPKFGIEAVTLRQSPAKQLANKGPMFKRKLLYLGLSKKNCPPKRNMVQQNFPQISSKRIWFAISGCTSPSFGHNRERLSSFHSSALPSNPTLLASRFSTFWREANSWLKGDTNKIYLGIDCPIYRFF